MTPRLEKVRELAIKFHGDQKYGDKNDGDAKPYVYHLDKVTDVLRRFGFKEVEDESLFVAAYLHDVLEDCPDVNIFVLLQNGITHREVELIYAVTNEEGKNRKERHEKTYAGKIVPTLDAILLKLPDRIANVEEKGKIGMYRKEHPDFARVLRRARTTRPFEVTAMWEHLNRLIDLKAEDYYAYHGN